MDLTLPAAIDRRSWDWLAEIAQRLGLAVDVLDPRGAPILPPPTSRTGTHLRRVFTSGDYLAPRLEVLSRMAPSTAGAGHIGDLLVACAPIGSAERQIGTLVVARDRPSGESERAKAELLSMASWLAVAVEPHLSGESGSGQALERMALLNRLLNQAAQAGSDRDVVRALAEALAVWDDLEVQGYVQDLRGKFVIDVTLAGADQTHAPAYLPEDAIPAKNTTLRLTAPASVRLGFRESDDVLMLRIEGDGLAPRVLAVVGPVSPDQEKWLLLCGQLLDEALKATGTRQTSHLTWAILQHLFTDLDAIDETGMRALRELDAVLAGATTGLKVMRPTGAPLISLGNTDEVFAGLVPESARLVARVSVEGGAIAELGAVRLAQTFNLREKRLIEMAASLFASWLAPAVRRAEFRDRRAVLKSFDQTLEQYAEAAYRQGVEVSLMVVVPPVSENPAATNQWALAKLRARLRASDLAGLLSDGSIGVLLYKTSAHQARIVAGRVRKVLGADTNRERGEPTAIGIAAPRADSSSAAALLREARAEAERATRTAGK